jgi:hypothetical protein
MAQRKSLCLIFRDDSNVKQIPMPDVCLEYKRNWVGSER